MTTIVQGGSTMRGLAAALAFGAVVIAAMGTPAVAEEKTIATQKAKDVVITLKSEAGQWKQGKNSFVLEFTSAKDQQPVDAGKVSLSTSMTMTGMAPMIASAMRRALIVGLAVALTLAAAPVERGQAQSMPPAGEVTVDELVARAVAE